MVRLLPPDGEHGWTPYVWLFYTSLYIAFPFWAGVTGTVWLGHAAGLLAFLTVYFRAYWVDGARRLPLIVALAALGTGLSWINPGALMFFIYAAAFVGGSCARGAASAWILGLTFAGGVTAWLTGWPPFLLIGVVVLAPMIGFVNVHYSEVRRRDAALKLAQHEIARLAALAERDRIAGDLHDLLGHTLSVIVLKAELASKLLGRDQGRAASEIADVERISRDALAEVRQAVQGFRSATLADELVRARAVLGTAGVASEVSGDAARGVDLPGAVEHALALVLREAITNVVRHASAATCRITIQISADRAILLVEDDGVGGATVEGSGFASMRARLRDVGGTFELNGRSGMHVRAEVPLS